MGFTQFLPLEAVECKIMVISRLQNCFYFYRLLFALLSPIAAKNKRTSLTKKINKSILCSLHLKGNGRWKEHCWQQTNNRRNGLVSIKHLGCLVNCFDKHISGRYIRGIWVQSVPPTPSKQS